MSYFNNNEIYEKLLLNSPTTLRGCQHGALLAILAHFTASDEPAIISLPTGSGKTELMFATTFSLKAKHVLVVEPSRFLKSQTHSRFKQLSVFRQSKIIAQGHPEPKVHELHHSLTSEEKWNDLSEYDVVVATPKTVSPEESIVSPPPDELFDLIFIDEAHHAAAKTWRAIVKAFPKKKIVLLTATAFRRDRRRLPGRLIYHYPIGKALDDKIYRPIEFVPVRNSSTDKRIAEVTAKKFRQELELNPDATLLIRTDRIAKCSELSDIYRKLGVETVEIHSGLIKSIATDRLEKLRSGEVKAAVTVGMMAEGIDIPRLKVASLHALPKSLPYTLQLVGRMSRNPKSQTGPACLIAALTQVSGEAQNLFREDRDWKRLIPRLVENAIQDAHGSRRANVILNNSNTSPLIPELFTPFFSVTVEEFIKPTGKVHTELFPLDLDKIKGLPKDVESIELLSDVDEGCTTLVTVSAPAPLWGKDSGLTDLQHDLHVLYNPPSTRIIFITTTAPKIIKAITDELLDETTGLDPIKLQSALSDVVSNEYKAVGLENALGLTGTHPSYRIHIGPGSGTSIRPSDGAIFGPGHALGKMLSNKLRGVAVGNRRIWEIRRESVRVLTEWCRELSMQISVPGSGLPGLTFLAQPVPAQDLFSEQPIAIISPDRLFGLPFDSLVQKNDISKQADNDLFFTFEEIDEDSMRASLSFRDDSKPIQLSYTPTANPSNWVVVEDEREFELILHDLGERQSLGSFLCDHPPIIIMPNGGAIRGNYGWQILKNESALSASEFKGKDWSDTDIKKESREAANGFKNVQEKTLELLRDELSDNCIIVVDDGPHEIADIVAVDPINKKILFIHCKYSNKTTPGNRVIDWNELFAQCARSHAWVRHGKLLYEIDQRIDRRKNTILVKEIGARADLKFLINDYKPNEWKYHVRAVQPGCNISKLFSEPNSHVYKGLNSVQEWLHQAGASFDVWASDESDQDN